jgi:hypothetical protein
MEPTQELRRDRLWAREHGHLRAEVRKFLQIARNLALVAATESRQAILDVGGVADLRSLPVAHDIDADRHLLLHDLRSRLAHRLVENGRVERLAALLPEQHVDYGSAAGQTPDVGGENAVSAEFHGR